MIFIDSNVPMYLIGAAHPLKEEARDLLERAVRARERLVTDAEVFQEILHRYTAIERPEAIQPAFDSLLTVVDVVHPVELADVRMAKSILFETPSISSRDAIHAAIMRRYGVRRIMSFDRGFDALSDITRHGG